MPHFHFHLRASRTIHRDAEGTDLPDMAAGRAHAAEVAQELMRHAQGNTHLWSMCVEDEQGERQFDLFFANVDPRVAAYSPQLRGLVAKTCRRMGALTDTMCASRTTLMELRQLIARARGRPQLVYARGT